MLETRLIELENSIGQLYRSLTSIRREVSDLIPKRAPNLRHYDRWAQRYNTLLEEKVATQRRAIPLKKTPLISILCPTWRPAENDFRAALDSIVHQTYPHWELILIDDGSKCARTQEIIQEYCALDPRIQAIILEKNQGIAEATNAGLRKANGAYIVFFDHDDLLSPVAIEVMTRAALQHKAKLIYCDEDKIDAAGHLQEPNLKPDYDYRYLLGCNYICHLTMIDAATTRKIGFLDAHYDGAQDHDYVLRCTELLKETDILHVPEILYHWRKTPNSTAARITNKGYAITAGISCVTDHLNRKKRPADVTSIDHLSLYKVAWKIRRSPSVDIIIPFRDQVESTRRCVESLLTHVRYKKFRILLIDNFSIEPETFEFLEQIQKDDRVSIMRVEEPFNFARLNNLAAAQCESDFLLFLNNDVYITQENFLSLMIAEALALPKIGAVGARLLYPNATIQHAGVAVGPDVIGVHVHRAQPHDAYGYVGRIRLSHEVTAVTAAAMLVRRDLFHELGGFDEAHLSIAYNDVDLCLKIRQKGLKIIYCADAEAEHHESFSRGTDNKPENEPRFFQETQTMIERWKHFPPFENDPAYPHYFRKDHQTFFDLRDPEELW
nr:glycosyltransferase family 2 protein [Saccharibacter sp. 17.LH.SD]